MNRLIAVMIVAIALGGCATADYDPYVTAVEGQLETRSYQTRQIESTDYETLMTAVISTLQDYHFRIVDIDPDLGTVTAYQVTNSVARNRLTGRTGLTVMVRSRGEHAFNVRMNMTTGPKVQNEPELYQQFFSALHRKLHYRTGA